MIRKGRHTVTCKECSVEGMVEVGRSLSRGRRVKVKDFVVHAETCSQFVRAQPKHLKRKNWRKQEKRANALVGARATIASGSLGEDGDGRLLGQWRVESKQTRKWYFNLRQDVWHKLVHGALLNGEEPLLHVEIADPLPVFGVHRMVVIRKDLYEAMGGNAHPPCDPSQENRVSWRIEHNIHPHEVRLEPIGVVVTEAVFERLKKEHERTEAGL